MPAGICNSLPKLALLWLDNNDFFGNLPPSLVRQQSLWHNRFTGRVPENIGNLSKLELLYLSDNNLKGSIVSTIFNISSLKYFNIANNSLHGTIPVDLCDGLPALEALAFGGNKISGTILKNIGNCTLLKDIDIGINPLTGEIPQEMGKLHNLESLFLAESSLTGLIPPTIFNISTIININLAFNDLSGHLPTSTGHWLPNLKVLILWGNKLSGTIPNSISNASQLTILELSQNSFSGLIPNIFGNLRFLYVLNLGYNNFTTNSPPKELTFLSSLTKCRKLKYLIFSSNPLYGVLPPSIGNISTSLQILAASDCKLMGIIPKGVGNLQSLTLLELSYNELNGSMPTTMGRLLNLQGLYLRHNNLQGPIPYDLCNLERLNTLYLFGNKLFGHIPTCIASLSSLRNLDLSSNKLTSNIPSSLWNLGYILYVNLSSNSLSGSLALDIQNLTVLITLDLSRNQLSGNIPITTGDLKDLVFLSLADNKFGGSIPNSCGALISLEWLELSDNNLSGEIPKSLEKLLYLKHFNVSHNMLEGEIPVGGPFKNFSSHSFMWNYALCGSPRLQVPSCKKGTLKRSNTTIILVLEFLLPLVVSTILVVILITMFVRYRNRSLNCLVQEDFLPPTWRRTSYLEIQQATDAFSECNLLGTGSFGSVYKGTFSDGISVAIKIFNLQPERAFRSFDSECEVLRNIRHRNLIKILSSCCNDEFKALVLEFMPNGSLEKWLYSHNYFLDMLQRLNIMIDVASALEYLHHSYSTPIVHCDLKPDNILLDENMVPHVSDFGIAKLLGEEDIVTRTMTMATIGYMAPEYGSMGIVSTRGDVYSYGVLLMETFSRKMPTDDMFVGEMSLKHMVESLLPHAVIEFVDVNLLQDQNDFAAKVNCVLSIMDLALHCSMESPEQRINMEDALAKLKKIKMQFVKDVGA